MHRVTIKIKNNKLFLNNQSIFQNFNNNNKEVYNFHNKNNKLLLMLQILINNNK